MTRAALPWILGALAIGMLVGCVCGTFVGVVSMRFSHTPKTNADSAPISVEKTPVNTTDARTETPSINAGSPIDFYSGIYEQYQSNEAAADGKYLGKRLDVHRIPKLTSGVEKDKNGTYYFWACMITGGRGRHIERHALFYFKNPSDLRTKSGEIIRGICRGKRGTVPTLPGEDWPVVVFEDCEFVK